MSVEISHMADGRIKLSGKTFAIKDTIKEHKGIWNPDDKSWNFPKGTDLSWVKQAVADARAVAAEERAASRTAWLNYCAKQIRPVQRSRTGRCCSAAVPTLDPVCPQGPMIYVCAAHGTHKSDYAGS